MPATRLSANQVFDFGRFSRLFARHTAEHLRGYLLTAAVGAGGMLLILGFIAYLNKSAPAPSHQGTFFVLFLLGGGSIFASTVFAQFGDRRQASVALLLPASHLEKYLVVWLYSVPLFLLVFIPLFYLAAALVVHVAAAPGQTPELLNLFKARQDFYGVFWFFFLLHAVCLWGAVYFEKAHFIKTGFAVFLGLAVLSLLNFQVLKGLLGGDVRFTPPFTGAGLKEGEAFYTLTLPETQAAWLALLPLALAGLLWLAAYFRVTEKQL
ncbi:hypothetical protein [uncultured Hymenobacter sp.]|uniref:hypothetical protein n=1 Tax=uncultured Hymenobacter sp. TaxID=170016 RepID=UPI0035CC3F8E